MILTEQQRAELRAARERKRKAPAERTDTPHNRAIDALLAADSALKRTGFAKSIRKQICQPELDGPPDDRDDERPFWSSLERDVQIRPDAHKIVDGEVWCYEVVDACRLDPVRRDAYGMMWFAFDSDYIVCRLWVCDVYGNKSEQSLEEWYQQYTIPALMRERHEDNHA